MENTEFIQLYNEFKAEQSDDFHFQLLSEMIDIGYIQGNRITLKAQNEFSRDNFKARYLLSLQKKVLQKTKNALLEIILERQAKSSADSSIEAVQTQALSSRIPYTQEFQFGGSSRSADNIDYKQTFINYVEGNHNRWAIAVGKALSKEKNESYNPFFVWGNVGLGKTHLLHAIGNACKDRHQKVQYTNTETFFNNFVRSIKTNKQEYFKKKYRNVDVLLFDDIHDLKKKNAAQEELFYIFEHFRQEGKQLVFTCDRPPHELKEFTERLLSRLKSGTNVSIGQPSYEVRLAILEAKSSELGLGLSQELLQFLAENISDSIRDLHGSLKKIHTLTGLLGQQIDVAMASRELQEFFGSRQKPVLVRNIQTHVANYYNLELADILGKRRNANIALARQVAMFLSRELTPLSTTELGQEFNRDHATVITGVRKIKKIRENDQKFASELDCLKREMQAAY